MILEGGLDVKKIISVILILILIILPISGCTESKPVAKYNIGAIDLLESQLVTQNDNFSLSWNSDKQCVIFENKLTGKKWSNIPYDLWLVRSWKNVDRGPPHG